MIQSAFAEFQITEVLRERVLHLARTKTRHAIVPLEDVAGTDVTCERLVPGAGRVDTVLQISIQGYGTKAAWKPKPPVALFMDAQVQLLRGADGTVLHRRTATWASLERPLAKWAAAQGEPVREELARGIQDLAEQIVYELFLLRSPP